MELFGGQLSADRLHPYYRKLTSGSKEAQRATLTEWAKGFPDRDGKFAIEFQTTFNSSFWELYLHAAVRSLGVEIDFTRSSPDFCCSHAAGNFVMEATTSRHADGYRAPWQGRSKLPTTSEDWAAALEYSSVRLANALDAKLKKYSKSYRSLSHVAQLPFAVAVAPFEQLHTYALGARPILRVLYSYDMLVYENFPERQERVVRGHAEVPTVWKPNGSPIPFGLFTDARAADVSAVIFSSVATFGKLSALSGKDAAEYRYFSERVDENSLEGKAGWQQGIEYKETLLDGLQVFLNPYAKHRFPVEIFADREVAIYEGCEPATKVLRASIPNNFLVSRFVDARTEAPQGIPVHPDPVPAGSLDPQMAPWPDSALRYVGGHVGTFNENYLAHYRGWTIVVCHDTVDDDWSALACEGTYRDLISFIEANQTSRRSIILGEFLPTKETAADAIQARVDQITPTWTSTA